MGSEMCIRDRPLIEGLYDGSAERQITTEVVFEDGRRGEISANVRIEDMPLYSVEESPQELRESA